MNTAILALAGEAAVIAVVVGAIILLGLIVMIIRFWKRVDQGQALIVNTPTKSKVSFRGTYVLPIIHKHEYIDISVKRIEIDRTGEGGLICRDNIRADIKVAFFVRVNGIEEDVRQVAKLIGCERASQQAAIADLFEPKFSEALKTVGKRFDFVELYNERDTFKEEILKVIGTDLNGFVLDDCAIDFLEQTPLASLDPTNMLDAEGIKKITEQTATQNKLTNNIRQDEKKVIKQQDVEAEEAILELERQLAETTAKQAREVMVVRVREEAEGKKAEEEERYKFETARITTEEELAIAEENKDRQILVAQRNKERTDGVELERVEKERELEAIERMRETELKKIEMEKSIEIERKAIQDVIRERVTIEKTVVAAQEEIKDTEAFAAADRAKQVAVTEAEKEAEAAVIATIKEAQAAKDAGLLEADEALYTKVKGAESEKEAAELLAQQVVIAAEANREAAAKDAESKTLLADATRAEAAAEGLGDAEVVRAKASAEAAGIKEKAEAMKLFEEAGREHEEFRLELDKAKEVELAEISVQERIAAQQALVVGEALKSANIDIVGGETEFFDRITKAITNGKVVDRTVNNSQTLTDAKDTFFSGDGDQFKDQVQTLVDRLGMGSEDLKNLSVAALLGKLATENGKK